MRDTAGLTQQALADAIGEPQQWVHTCETGSRRVDLAEFCRWCSACGVKPTTGLRRYLDEID